MDWFRGVVVFFFVEEEDFYGCFIYTVLEGGALEDLFVGCRLSLFSILGMISISGSSISLGLLVASSSLSPSQGPFSISWLETSIVGISLLERLDRSTSSPSKTSSTLLHFMRKLNSTFNDS